MLMVCLMCTAQANGSVEMSCSSGTDLSLTLSFQVLSALHSAWLDKLARGLQSTNKLMPALRYGCLQINLKITVSLLISSVVCSLCQVVLGKMENFELKIKYQI